MPEQKLVTLALEAILPSVTNPRFALTDVEQLADSIAEVGLLQPIIVTPRGKEYLIVAGHRRHAAAKLAGLTELPVVIREMTDVERQEAMLIENVERVNLSPVEEGIGYARLMKQHGYSQRQVAERVGRTQAWISKCLAILRQPKDVVEAVHRGEVNLDVALGYGQGADSSKRIDGQGKRLSTPVKAMPRMCDVDRHATHSVGDCEVRRMAETRERV